MNSVPIRSEHPPNVSGALRYERVAILEATLSLKEKRDRQRWIKASAALLVVGTLAVGFVLGNL